MSEREDRTYVLHMLECISVLEQCLEKGAEAFELDMIVRGAVLRYLQEIGESSKHLSEVSKGKFPHIPWNKIRAFRNVLVHDYLGVDMHMVYRVAEHEMPKLKTVLLELRNEKEQPS